MAPQRTRIWCSVLLLAACQLETTKKPPPGTLVGGATNPDGDGGSGTGGDGDQATSPPTGVAGNDGGGGAGGNGAGDGDGDGDITMTGDGDGDITMTGDGDGDGDGDVEVPCDTNKTPIEEPCLRTPEHAVFVSVSGRDEAAGTPEDPLSTIAGGIARARYNQVSRVIVCAGTYRETVSITDGQKLELFGGFVCGDGAWEYEGDPTDPQTIAQPDEDAPALVIRDNGFRVLIDSMGFIANDARDEGGSSIAAEVHDAGAVELKRVSLHAGDGKAGRDGSLTEYPYPNTGNTDDGCRSGNGCLAGYDANGSNGGNAREYECPTDQQTVGGAGGFNVPPLPTRGTDGRPRLGAGRGGQGATNGSNCGGGDRGEQGRAGTLGEGATTFGALEDGAWLASAGTAGGAGSVGQGGGGGGAGDGRGG
ncbi:MAG: hypothetical protein OXR73_02530, partial [Myxococcales bacterium]|nr:hypothetical protein [Myxococcales bacterium]